MIASIADPGAPSTSTPFGHALNVLAAQDERIVGLTADLGTYTDRHVFAKENPIRYFEMGMAEQVMMMAASSVWGRTRVSCSRAGTRQAVAKTALRRVSGF